MPNTPLDYLTIWITLLFYVNAGQSRIEEARNTMSLAD